MSLILRTGSSDDCSRASYRKWLKWIVLAALIIRAAILLFAELRPERFDFPDSHRYVLVARNIAAGNGPVQDDAFSGTDPLYPLLLSPAIFLGVEDEAAILRFGRLVNVVCAIGSIFLLAAFARRLAGSRVALIAATILAVDPILLYFNALVLTESGTITLLLATYYCLMRLKEPAPLVWALLAGICAGLSILLHGGNLFIPILLVPFVWGFVGVGSRGIGTSLCRSIDDRRDADDSQLTTATKEIETTKETTTATTTETKTTTATHRRDADAPQLTTPPTHRGDADDSRGGTLRLGGRDRDPSRPAAVGCFLLAAVFMLCPVIIRNYRLFGAFVPVRTGSGESLLEALGPWADGGPGMDRIVYPVFPPGADEVERDRLCRAAAIDWARSNPRAVAALAWTKLCRTWSIVLHAHGYTSPFHKLVCWLTVAPIFGLAVGGVWLWRRRPADIALLLLPAAYLTLMHVVFVGSVRYRVPAMPFLFILAAVPIGSIRFGSRDAVS